MTYLLVAHLHEDGAPAVGMEPTEDSRYFGFVPWRDLGDLSIDQVRRVVDEHGSPAYLVDLDVGRRLDGAYPTATAAISAAIEAINAGQETSG